MATQSEVDDAVAEGISTVLVDVIDRAIIHLVSTKVRGNMDDVQSIEVKIVLRGEDEEVLQDFGQIMTLEEGEEDATV